MSDVPPTQSIPKPEEPKEPQQSPQQPQFQQYLRITTNFHLKVTTHHKASRTTLLSLCLTSPTLGCSSKLHPSNSNLSPRETKTSKKV
ncbi:hypothetical protein TVAG_194630 [Trichomonas vaginalis G3]|uniref:Uncharacterized protein n=1 Tax=Trichomonas vaginalis (strain ATCC PRA-98 / G3) TaxID=412133 RepID=A2GQ18_TRIV3|nr:hypothetical protein TVAGG3_0584910 [Trichomonas vaginalis G3]EAX80749.1 hypothetical protein TVAG_194630 [Trichomonas vaginalis G3]KAI5522820.1 hypothetical protein TVAGG3_0584910 [Trichomonas vaginalis G3]|eukprot:XP_001293679.1 hypothetical protein [Trichomonas vaginalis G3]